MHETGVLAAIFPEMERIECLVIRDFFHRYTVDEHTVVTMQNLRSLPAGYAELLAEVKQPSVVMFALLFHDVGKGVPGEGPVDASVRLARGAMARIQMPAPDRETALFLIRKHLELSAVMQTRDLYDPQTIRDVAHQMETVERLKALTLVTYADISAVNPNVMTPWRAEQLWQLYLAVYNELTRELETERIEAIPSGPPERIAFLEGFPTRYLRTHTEQEIDEHMALEEKGRTRGAPRGVAVDIRRLESAWQLTLVAADRPFLFASVAGTLSSFGMNILKAEAFANRRGLVLDTFTFDDPLRTLDLNPTEAGRLRATTERVLAGKTDVRELLRNRPKPVLPSRKARIPATVSFNSEAGHTATLVEIVAEDRPGLLYDLASAISSNGGNIEVVLIDTQAHKAIDVFYVTAEGKKLGPEKQRILAEALRKAVGD
jgi:[protein-PII] uridylyltransferase